MDGAEKLKILLAGRSEGVKACCARYGISRTLYYRWLRRYESRGMAGLEEGRKRCTPPNKTDPGLVSVILSVVRNNPAYGPRELAYRLGDMGRRIGESAVYNVLRRENLSTRAQRQNYAARKERKALEELPRFGDYGSGECWLFWTSFYGHFETAGSLYAYSILDLKSRMACTRLYTSLHIGHFSELLEGVAIPVARLLRLEPKHWCLFDRGDLKAASRKRAYAELYDLAYRHSFDVKVHAPEGDASLPSQPARQAMEAYNRRILSDLLPLLQDGADLKDIKIRLQERLRDYNMLERQDFGGKQLAPLDYHAEATGCPKILPVWVYMERDY